MTHAWIGRALLVGALGLASACGSLESSHVVTGTPSAPVSGDVRVVMQGQEPAQGFEEIAVVQAVGAGNKAKMPLVLEKLKAEARTIGGNGVINVRFDQGARTASASGVAVRFQ